MFPSLDAATSCSSFPKIFGGSFGTTTIFQIDVFDDYLANCGYTLDSSLTGVTSTSWIPFISLTSISVSTKYYWSKAFPLKTGAIYGVKFSTDGALLIAHSGFIT